MWFCDFVLRTPPRGGGWGPILKFLRPKWPILKFLRSKHRKRTLRCQRHLKWRLWRRRRRKPSQIINQTSRTVGFKRFYPGKFPPPSAEILKFSPPSAATFTNFKTPGIPRFKWLQNSKSYCKMILDNGNVSVFECDVYNVIMRLIRWICIETGDL